jgi:hypothetical protein
MTACSVFSSFRRRMPLVASAVIGFAIATAACGGGSSQAGVAGLGTTTIAPPAATGAAGGSHPGGDLLEYATCMRSHGVLSFPGSAAFGSSGGIEDAKGQMAQITKSEGSSSTFQAALRACAEYYGPPPTSSPQVSSQEMRRLLAVSRCMRAHGVPTFPDPNPTTGELNAPADIDRGSPQVVAALQACRSLGEAAGLGPPST